MKMTVSEKKMRHLGRRVADVTGDGDYQELLEEQHRLIVSQCYNNRHSRILRYAAAGALSAAAAVVLAILFIGTRQQSQVPFWIGPGQTAGEKGSWVEASDKGSTLIKFEGGSRFWLEKGGAARVIEANTENVVVDLSRGDLHCKVHGNRKTRWIVRAGTYQVTVTGTIFTVNWIPDASSLNVFVSRGSVLVSGASLKPHGVALSVGDHLNIVNGEIFMTNENTGSQGSADPSITSSEDPLSKLSAIKTKGSNSGSSSDYRKKKKQNNNEVPEWKKRYDQKDYAGAIAAANAEGMDRLSRTLDAEELWQLSRASRFALDGAAASKLLLAVTNRFPGSDKADNATFLLGRVNEELLNNADDARRWYEHYLSMGQNKKLSEAALGRLIGVCQRSGLDSKAKAYAREYIVEYSEGLFAKRAHSVLTE